jgi:uncharacterized repeat protein (TIGR01451 family)
MVVPEGFNQIARWTPGTNSWSTLKFGLPTGVYGLAARNGEIFAGGSLLYACGTITCPFGSGVTLNNVGRWDGSDWQPVANGLGATVLSLAVLGNDVIAGGNFIHGCPPAGACMAQPRDGLNSIARFDGTAWRPVGFGLSSSVEALRAVGPALFAGGFFERICGETDCSGAGTGASKIARWDPTTSTWFPLGSGLTDSSVYALAQSQGFLNAGGQFGTAGGKASAFFARFGPIAEVGVGATDAPDPATFLGPLTYTAVISNTGPGAATGVTLTATLGPGVLFQSVSATAGSCTGAGPVQCALGTIPAGGAVTVTIQTEAAVLGPAGIAIEAGSTSVDPVAGNDRTTAVAQVVTATPSPTATPTLVPGSPTATPTLPPGVPTFTPTPTPTLQPGQSLPVFLGNAYLNQSLE